MKKLNDVTMRRNGLRNRLMPHLFHALFPNPPTPPLIKGGEGGFLVYALCFLFLSLCSVLYASSSEAKVTGNCSNCHTMHNSQNGQCQAKIYSGGSPVTTCTPQGVLLKGDCLGCHGQGTSSNIIENGIIPQVLHTNSTDLAGGNFAYITGTGGKLRTGADQNTAGHNVVDLGSSFKDTVLTAPPGDQHSTGITNNNFTCAGIYGCHGDRTVAGELLGIKGAHHTDDSVLKFGSINTDAQGGSTGLSYRFLKSVKGGEDTDWQATSSATDHNEYFGATSMGASSATSPANSTISGLCAECHGNYHGDGGSGDPGTGTASPWLRHPTDYVLPGAGTEYQLYNSGTGSDNPYSLTVPVARGAAIPNTVGGIVKTGTSGADGGIVMCLSCHRAHASPYFKIMRWDYKSWPASGTNGCAVCHTSKI